MRSKFLNTWRAVASNMADVSASKLYLDILNEPQRGTEENPGFCDTHWTKFAVDAVDQIVSANGQNIHRPLIIAGCNPDEWADMARRVGPILNALRSSSKYQNPLIASFHYYDPNEATHWLQRCKFKDAGKCGCPKHLSDKLPATLENAGKCKPKSKPKTESGEAINPLAWKHNNKYRFD